MALDLVGLQEVADLAGVTASAVVNWRKRFVDFPSPIAELKSGPVFARPTVQAWLAQRGDRDLAGTLRFYDRLAAARGDSAELMNAVEETVKHLLAEDGTSLGSPGVLLGKIQSGKTRAYLGIIARAFDRNYDAAVVLTKGTKSLARQTLSRIRTDFHEFIESDQVQVFDIMSLPSLTPYEVDQKLIFVVKKEDDNLRRLLTAFEDMYPELRSKRVLIVDDEADLASVSFRKQDGVAKPGTVSTQIDRLRELVADSDVLQVTATPYSLYLQPENDIPLASGELVKPKRPRFTVVLPTHADYVGGDYYFEQRDDEDSLAYYFYREVPGDERQALKKEDRRRLKIENILTDPRASVLRDAMLAFVAGAVIRRLQSAKHGEPLQKYTFLFHTEQARRSHEWQERLATALHAALVKEAKADTPRFNELLTRAVTDLGRSVAIAGTQLPSWQAIKTEVVRGLADGYMMITRVNSDKDIDQLLDANGQLKLRTPFNVFIGGQILDRGLTVGNLIAFYYGRDPKRFQQDTVLQHSRMYGVRPIADLAVTRFYAPRHVYQVMATIHALDAALREAFESGAHDRGVYFLQKDAANRIVPCSPNKLMLSDIATIRPGRRLLPKGFQTVSRSAGLPTLKRLDARLSEILCGESANPVLIAVEDALDLVGLAYLTLVLDDQSDGGAVSAAALEHLSRSAADPRLRGKVWLLTARDRKVARYREEGRFSDAPDTKQQADLARARAQDIPVLMLLRQTGDEELGWRGLPFWWPVIVVPKNSVTSVFARRDGTGANR